MPNIKNLIKLTKEREKNYVKINLLFIFVFLNIWDFVANHEFFNGMILGIFLFGPAVFLWFVGKIRLVALVTLISILEFVMMAIFIAEGFELGGSATYLKSIFWAPYLAMAGLNGYWGLKVYSDYREKNVRKSESI